MAVIEAVRKAGQDPEQRRGMLPAPDRWATGVNYALVYEDAGVVMLTVDVYAVVNPLVPRARQVANAIANIVASSNTNTDSQRQIRMHMRIHMPMDMRTSCRARENSRR